MLRNFIKHLFNFFILSSKSLFALIPLNEISYSCVDSENIPIDHKIIERIGICNGIFIEVGAYDGVIQSNTKLLEEFYGWKGILVEPSPVLFNRLVNNRPHSKCFQCALSTPEQNDTYIYGDFDGSLMSSIEGERRNNPAKVLVQVRSLQSILDQTELQNINFFSLDVEGHELDVLKGIDFSKSRFDYILVEIYTSSYDEIASYLEKYGYRLLENFSNYNSVTNPRWDGTHNDYLFQYLPIE